MNKNKIEAVSHSIINKIIQKVKVLRLEIQIAVCLQKIKFNLLFFLIKNKLNKLMESIKNNLTLLLKSSFIIIKVKLNHINLLLILDRTITE